jgi:large subunit ribosomal protein L15
MQNHELRSKTKKLTRKRIARGGSHGKTSGRGEKGQKSRAGRRMRPELRDFIKKFPKKRGYKFQIIDRNIVSLDVTALNAFKSGEVVNPASLVAHGLLSAKKGRAPKVKIIGNGELKSKVLVERCAVSKQARERIMNAGGEVKV